jgi:hypothetical protein
MLERNMRVKESPERWQDEKKHFDIVCFVLCANNLTFKQVVTFEDRVFDMLIEGNLLLIFFNSELIFVRCS